MRSVMSVIQNWARQSGLYFGNPIYMRQVRQAEKTIAERYRAKGFDLVNAD